FDLWMRRAHPNLPWCRYADDGLVHCRTAQEAEALKAELQARLAECRLELHPAKTKIVYCKDGKRKGMYPNVGFDFLGFRFRPRERSAGNPHAAFDERDVETELWDRAKISTDGGLIFGLMILHHHLRLDVLSNSTLRLRAGRYPPA